MMIKCEFCGKLFDENSAIPGCRSCPMSRTCNKYKCPNCGYEIPKEPGLIKYLKRKLKKTVSEGQSKDRNKPMLFTRLSELPRGSAGSVVELDTNDPAILKKLVSMGILPGVPLQLIRTFPSYVIQVGFTQVAIDREIASVILLDEANLILP